MTIEQWVRVAKFLAVMGFAGGAIAAFVSDDTAARKRAAHRVASPSLVGVWLLGFVLLSLKGWPLFDLWVLGALVLSVASNAALSVAVARNRRGLGAFLWVAAPLAGTVVLMVFKPSWVG